ncbi:MAG: DUF3990 domain-containing protein [Coriobacteriaceae bacterium]|nr:DUF3990 domain-containing protein [Coriobacteriaceae bacterium]
MGNTAVTLFHGSKEGLDGPIRPVSRPQCDFGSGFYMGTDRLQPLTLVCNAPSPHLYELELELHGLTVLQFDANIDWALFIAYNRGKLEEYRGTELYRHYEQLGSEADVIVGKIANDRMFVVLDRFFSGTITDSALIACLASLNIGSQYVAKTDRACRQISIEKDRALTPIQCEEYDILSQKNRSEGIAAADRICRAHRREGRYFDEILEDWRA